MPYTISEHQETKVIDLNNFTGGMHVGLPSTQILDNECELMENMFLDPNSGRPRTRYPIAVYTGTAAGAPVNGLYYWKNFWILTTTAGYAYYLSGTTPTSLGVLNSTSRPVFAPYNDKLIIATGGVIQSTAISSVPTALANVSGGVTSSYVFQRYSRLVSSGDASYPDRVYEAAYKDETSWPVNDYADVGYLDDTSVIGITEAFEGMYIVFKRGSSGLKTYYLTSLSNTNPSSILATDGHAPRSHAGVAHAMGKIYLMEERYVSRLIGTEKQGAIEYDASPGMKLQARFSATANGFAVVYPPDFQIWFIPDPTRSEVYVYHYLKDAWSTFSFGSRRLYSAYYEPTGGYLYLGCDDGHVYKYNHAAVVYQDTAGNYAQRLITKTFSTGNREAVLKSPTLHWYYLSGGSGTFYAKFDYGTASQNWGTLTISDGNVWVYDKAKGLAQDLTTYAEVDDNSVISATSSAVTMSDTSGWDISEWLYKDFSAGYFSGDFEFHFDVVFTPHVVSSGVFVWGVANVTTGLAEGASNMLTLRVECVDPSSPGVGELIVDEVYNGVTTSKSCAITYSGATTYSIHVYRDEAIAYGTLYVYIYNGTTLAGSLTLPLSSKQDFRYYYPMSIEKWVPLGSSGSCVVSSVYLNNAGTFNTVYVYDTRAGGADELYVYPGSGHESLKADYAKPSDTFQFDIAITSGALSIDRITAEVSSGRRS